VDPDATEVDSIDSVYFYNIYLFVGVRYSKCCTFATFAVRNITVSDGE
jgi:hypothetical protein